MKKVVGDRSEEQRKADELNARIMIMMSELEKNKMDK